MTAVNKIDVNQWFPVATSEDLPMRHVYHTTLLGQELAVWRDDNGLVNAWENRCPHRGLRLTMGLNNGNAVRCQYHGWTYESGTGGCTFVPAHREAKEPSAVRVNSFPSRDKHGLIWISLGQPTTDPISILDEAQLGHSVKTNLRSVTFNVGIDEAYKVLRQRLDVFQRLYGVTDAKHLHLKVMQADRAIIVSDQDKLTIHVYLQRATINKTTIHAQALAREKVDYDQHKEYSFALNTLQRAVEETESNLISISDISDQTVEMLDDVRENLSKAPPPHYICEVVTRTEETSDISSYWLRPVGYNLPAFTPGMHISVTTPEGSIRQYSLVNSPDERESFIIGVKKEIASRGGSKSMHEQVKVGVQLKVTVPRNGFPLVSNGNRPVLIAGGIGITPILCMAHALHHQRSAYEIHYFARGEEHVPFRERFRELEPNIHFHFGLGPEETQAKLKQIMQAHEPSLIDVYTCGPQPMIEAVASAAKNHGLAEDAIHFEFFSKKNDAPAAGESYEVELKKSGRTFVVKAGQSLLQACAENDLQVESSCEQGVCGACMTGVLSGDIEHHDTYLSKKERESGKWIMPCVSRCKSNKLVLDL